MKLIASENKAKITWVYIHHSLSNGGNVIGYDAKCACGWETKTGGAIKSCITQEIWNHKYIDHDYRLFAKPNSVNYYKELGA